MLPLSLGLAVAASFHPVPYLTKPEARYATKESAQITMRVFTERTPHVWVHDCTRLERAVMRCQVRATGQRAQLDFRVRVVERPGEDYWTYGSRLVSDRGTVAARP